MINNFNLIYNKYDRNISIENRIWRSKLTKVSKTLELYKGLINKELHEEVIELSGNLKEGSDPRDLPSDVSDYIQRYDIQF